MATIAQVKAARALLEWTQEDLAARSGLSLPTVRRFEAQSRLRVSDEARLKMETALEKAGIEFTNGEKPGVRLNSAAGRSPGADDADDADEEEDGK